MLQGKEIQLKGTFKPRITLAYLYYTDDEGKHHADMLTLCIDGTGKQTSYLYIYKSSIQNKCSIF